MHLPNKDIILLCILIIWRVANSGREIFTGPIFGFVGWTISSDTVSTTEAVIRQQAILAEISVRSPW